MIAEDLLERGLSEAANEYDVPAGAVDRIRDQLAPLVAEDERSQRHWHLPRPTRGAWMALGAASFVLLVALAIGIGGGGNHGTGESGGATAASTALEPAAVPSPAAVKAFPPRHEAQRSTAGTVVGSGAASSAGTDAASGGTEVAAAPTAGGGVSAGPVQPVPLTPDRIVKTGELDLQVPKGEVTPTINRLTAIATLVRGYVADSRTSEGGVEPSGEVTLRVPVGSFEDAISRARAITGVKVLSLETAAKDVTSKYVDLQARLRALQDTRNTFLTLLSKANTIGETLAVQQHVTDVQTQIEQLQGQIKVLGNQSALSTLTVTVDQKVVPLATKVHHGKSGFRKAIDRSVSRFVHGIEAIIGIIGPLLLAVLLIALFWFGGRFGYRVLRRRMV